MNKKKIIILLSIIFLVLIFSIIIIYNNKNNKYYFELVDSDIIITIGEDYIEPGYKAYDKKGNNLASEVIVNNNININQIGTYTVTYKFKDNTLYRKVTVINKYQEETVKDNKEIYLSLLGDEKIYIPKNDEYIEKGAIAIDSNGVDISSTIVIEGTVDTNKTKEYRISYSINDTLGNTKKIERTVVVYELSYQYNKSCTEKKCMIYLTFNDNYYNKIIYPSGISSTEKFINYEITENGTYTFTIYDKFGYSTMKKITINEIKETLVESDDKPEEEPSVPITPSITNKIKNNLFVGDSRTVGMCQSYKLCENYEYIAEVSKNYSWFSNTAIPAINKKIENKRYNIIILLGVNDAADTESNGKNKANQYYDKISTLARTTWSEQNIIFVSVNPVIDGYSYTYTKAVNAFNKEIKTKILSSGLSNFKYCDTNSQLNITTSNAPDGLHYDKSTSQEIYNIIKNNCI